MTILVALQSILCSRINAAGIPVLVVEDMEAAEVLSTYINQEGGVAHITGPHRELIVRNEEDESIGGRSVDLYEIDLRSGVGGLDELDNTLDWSTDDEREQMIKD